MSLRLPARFLPKRGRREKERVRKGEREREREERKIHLAKQDPLRWHRRKPLRLEIPDILWTFVELAQRREGPTSRGYVKPEKISANLAFTNRPCAAGMLLQFSRFFRFFHATFLPAAERNVIKLRRFLDV